MPFQQYARYFEPEQLDSLTAAYDATWEELKASGMDLTTEPEISLVRRQLAQRILVSATAGGVRDVETLKDQALRSLRGRVCLLGETHSKRLKRSQKTNDQVRAGGRGRL